MAGVAGAARLAGPTQLRLLFALVGWLTVHNDVTFDQEIEAEERESIVAWPGRC